MQVWSLVVSSYSLRMALRCFKRLKEPWKHTPDVPGILSAQRWSLPASSVPARRTWNRFRYQLLRLSCRRTPGGNAKFGTRRAPRGSHRVQCRACRPLLKEATSPIAAGWPFSTTCPGRSEWRGWRRCLIWLTSVSSFLKIYCACLLQWMMLESNRLCGPSKATLTIISDHLNRPGTCRTRFVETSSVETHIRVVALPV